MVDRLLRVHIQSQRAFGPRWTLIYNSLCALQEGQHLHAAGDLYASSTGYRGALAATILRIQIP